MEERIQARCVLTDGVRIWAGSDRLAPDISDSEPERHCGSCQSDRPAIDCWQLRAPGQATYASQTVSGFKQGWAGWRPENSRI